MKSQVIAVGLVLGLPLMAARLVPSEINELRNSVEVLRARVAELESRQASQKVRAPFEVDDPSGKPILRVRADHVLEMLSSAGKAVLYAEAAEKCGAFKVQSPNGYPELLMGTNGTLGAFLIRDAAGEARATLSLNGGKTYLTLNNESHAVIAQFFQADNGGGQLHLGTPKGDGVVRAGVSTSGRCGRVETYPAAPPGRSMVGAAATFIVGAGC